METENRIGGKFIIGSKIGGGSFGEIFSGININTNEKIAIKFEPTSCKTPQLISEAKIMRSLEKGTGIPKIFWYGGSDNGNYMVMELLGSSLEDQYNFCHRKFTLRTTIKLADQMLHRIEFVHNNNIIHRDIKPDNFIMGLGSKSGIVHIIDFGLSKKYRDPRTKQHIPYRENKSLTGTARYASINTHMGIEQSRRDDLESIGYSIVYFYRGNLPWQGVRTGTKQEKYQKIMEKKIGTPVDQLCRGFPQEFINYMSYCRSLHFEEKPDYDYLRRLFQTVNTNEQFSNDFKFDWVKSTASSHGSSRSGNRRHKHKKVKHTEPQPLPQDEKISSSESAESIAKTIVTDSWPEFKDREKIFKTRYLAELANHVTIAQLEQGCIIY
ncbi:unnamed protein product [Blepharisma stoltei]|uniref:Casein kinase I n=1 Tax=Blepharisma stoltei TaxID=1481888 RepID=A0AAU9IY93_9CILI|nr:unnamed protein product [Blepharisma stoltei]